jgi:PAS domain S-box-containing protein
MANLLSSLPGMVYRCRYTPARSLKFASPGCQTLTGYRPDELVEGRVRHFSDIIHPDDRRLSWEMIRGSLEQGQPYSVEYRIFPRSGSVKWVRDSGRRVQTSGSEGVILEGYIIDINDQKRYERLFEKQARRFQVLRTIDAAIMASFDSRVTFDVILEQVVNILELDAADILILDPRSQLLHYVAGRGFKTGSLQHTNLRIGEGYAGVAAMERRVIQVHDLSDAPGEMRRSPKFQEESFKLYLGVPLIARGQVKGILELFHRTQLVLDPEMMEFLEILSGQVAIAIDNATLLTDLQQANAELSLAYDATLESWSQVQELREQGTTGHNKWLAELTVRLAQAMRISGASLLQIRRGALLFDIGKIAIPEKILKKPGPLNDAEREILRKHPTYSYNLLSSIPALKQAADIPYNHHERWDGAGYPRGLAGTDIPLAARIFSVVHVWDALRSERPYRKAWSNEIAIAYMKEQRGREFDPEVVDMFLGFEETR